VAGKPADEICKPQKNVIEATVPTAATSINFGNFATRFFCAAIDFQIAMLFKVNSESQSRFDRHFL